MAQELYHEISRVTRVYCNETSDPVQLLFDIMGVGVHLKVVLTMSHELLNPL